MFERKLFALILVGFVICEVFVGNVNAGDKKKGDGKGKKGYYFSANIGFGCGKKDKVSEPIILSRSQSQSSLASTPSRSSFPSMMGQNSNRLESAPSPRPSKPLIIESVVGPPPTKPAIEKPIVAPSPSPAYDQVFRQSQLAVEKASTSVPVPLPPFVPSPAPSAAPRKLPSMQKSASMRASSSSILNAPNSQKIGSSRFRDPSSVVSQMVNEVENRMKNNENPLLVPMPKDPPSMKMKLGRPKPTGHFDVPRVPNSDGKIL
ncbi:helix-loop-helix protein 11-like isoform X1 [Contarinia nasturtii]|uniref:helix-loop-helix protein 11-like isoform X1 n=1 Tax=Contarinia nasturtii TaxID=265458 RepID=UPI0012D4325D|nr:helix-loop-helix protein 11-like isoform X1 [Contarinia nasturtii]